MEKAPGLKGAQNSPGEPSIMALSADNVVLLQLPPLKAGCDTSDSFGARFSLALSEPSSTCPVRGQDETGQGM